MSTASPAQIAANRANAKLSTGPTSEEGRAKVSLNAVKSGLTGQTVVLPHEDAGAYSRLLARFTNLYSPQTEEEKTVVQSLVETEWRLARIPLIEHGVYTLGHVQLTRETADEDPALVGPLLLAEIYRQNQRMLSNLSIQETRLLRMRKTALARLAELQAARAEKPNEETEAQRVPEAKTAQPPKAAGPAQTAPPKAAPLAAKQAIAREIGFEFAAPPSALKSAA